MITITLPYPPSSNRYWRPVRIGMHITIVPTKEAKQYKKDVAWLCAEAGIRKPIEGRLLMVLQLYPHRPLDADTRIRKLGPQLWDDTVQCIDLMNADKVLCDALEGIAYANDKQIWKAELERMEPDDGEARVVVGFMALPPREVASAPQVALL